MSNNSVKTGICIYESEACALKARIKDLEEIICKLSERRDKAKDRVKELEEAMPDPFQLTLIAMSQRVMGREDLYDKLEAMIWKIDNLSKPTSSCK